MACEAAMVVLALQPEKTASAMAMAAAEALLWVAPSTTQDA
jgi:hypothetical protein